MRHRSPPLITGINVFVFLTLPLVLLVVFLVYPPPFHGGISIDVPKVSHPKHMRGARREDAVIISVWRDGRVYLGNDQIESPILVSAVPEAIRCSGEKRVYVQADARAQYRSVKNVVDALSAAEIKDVVFLVDERKQSAIAPR